MIAGSGVEMDYPGHQTVHAPAWMVTGAIISIYLSAIMQMFSGPAEFVALISSIYAVPAIALTWLVAGRA